MPDRAVCLLSGGLDSSTTLAIAVSKGFQCQALSFRYGQIHTKEIESAAKIAGYFGVDHRVMDLDLSNITVSALTG
ncbi:MAG TPA: 7-cyano-7-deazaguanine synthase, partial [Thermoplasmataceae archaeon]|nr:7-cyano-7-deazaguanine synthase [Thermoplasmataceae archaeon]